MFALLCKIFVLGVHFFSCRVSPPSLQMDQVRLHLQQVFFFDGPNTPTLPTSDAGFLTLLQSLANAYYWVNIVGNQPGLPDPSTNGLYLNMSMAIVATNTTLMQILNGNRDPNFNCLQFITTVKAQQDFLIQHANDVINTSLPDPHEPFYQKFLVNLGQALVNLLAAGDTNRGLPCWTTYQKLVVVTANPITWVNKVVSTAYNGPKCLNVVAFNLAYNQLMLGEMLVTENLFPVNNTCTPNNQ